MTNIPAFSGFPPEGIQFLRDLAQNNEKTWFEAHKDIYTQALQQPAVSLVAALGERLQSQFPAIGYDTRTNGSGSLMRIHRDVRFSANKAPYKTNVAMMFTPQRYKRMEAPGFGLQITPQQVELVAGLFEFRKPQLEAYREAVLDDQSGTALIAAVEQVRRAGAYIVAGEGYKRVPRGYDADHPRAEWLKYKGLHAFAPPIAIETAYSAELIDAVMEHFRNMGPIQEWLMEALQF